MHQLKYTSLLTPNGNKQSWEVIVQNMLKYISHIHENPSNNPIKLIVHLVITFGSEFLFSFGQVSSPWHLELVIIRKRNH